MQSDCAKVAFGRSCGAWDHRESKCVADDALADVVVLEGKKIHDNASDVTEQQRGEHVGSSGAPVRLVLSESLCIVQ